MLSRLHCIIIFLTTVSAIQSLLHLILVNDHIYLSTLIHSSINPSINLHSRSLFSFCSLHYFPFASCFISCTRGHTHLHHWLSSMPSLAFSILKKLLFSLFSMPSLASSMLKKLPSLSSSLSLLSFCQCTVQSCTTKNCKKSLRPWTCIAQRISMSLALNQTSLSYMTWLTLLQLSIQWGRCRESIRFCDTHHYCRSSKTKQN